jgi:hypothetical protein
MAAYSMGGLIGIMGGWNAIESLRWHHPVSGGRAAGAGEDLFHA